MTIYKTFGLFQMGTKSFVVEDVSVECVGSLRPIS